MVGNIQLRRYMHTVVEDHRDAQTDEINATALAEDAAQHFNLYEADDIPERVFEVAYEIAREMTPSGIMPACVGGIVNRWEPKG
jgi:GH35 family endo-1,4-beta-xylanase